MPKSYPIKPEDTRKYFGWLLEGLSEDSFLEIRVLDPDKQYAALIGFYDRAHIEQAISDITPFNGRRQLYVGLNPRKTIPSVEPNKLQVPERGKQARAGRAEDILCMRHVFLDFDPVRSGGAATQDELSSAKSRAQQAFAWFEENGFHQPIVVMSGNGYHLVAKIPPQMDATQFAQYNQAFVHKMADMFSDALVKVDTNVFDSVRIAKIPGTMSVKGQSTVERPWRLSQIVRWADPIPDEKLANYIKALTLVTEEEKARKTESKPRSDEELAITLDECLFMQYAKEEAADLPEPLWYALVTNLSRFEHGTEAIHEWSKPYPNYTADETDKKITQAMKSSPGPHTCARIGQYGFLCPNLDADTGLCRITSVKSPAAFGGRMLRITHDVIEAEMELPEMEKLLAGEGIGMPSMLQALLDEEPSKNKAAYVGQLTSACNALRGFRLTPESPPALSPEGVRMALRMSRLGSVSPISMLNTILGLEPKSETSANNEKATEGEDFDGD